jgi:hypothetical protein
MRGGFWGYSFLCLYGFSVLVEVGKGLDDAGGAGLKKVAIFTTNVDAENQCLIKHKTVYEARSPALAKLLLSPVLLFGV